MNHKIKTEAEKVAPWLLSVLNTSTATGLSRSQIYLMLERRELEAVKVGRRLLIKASSIQAYVDSLPIAAVKGGARTKIAA